MKRLKAKLRAIALGQFLSLMLTGTAFASSLLTRQGINVPTSQSFINYFVLAVGCGTYLLLRGHSWQGHWGLYLSLAIVDVEASYFVVKAYQYTSITSVMLLDCWAIPCVLVLTAVILHTRYFPGHYIGVVLCVLGLCLVLLSDVHAGDRAGGSNSLLGDILVLVGGTLYAVSNTTEEFLVKRYARSEILAAFGFFGLIITIFQGYVLERKELESIHWNAKAILPFLAFSTCQLGFSGVLLFLLKTDGSAMLNLSLLTSDMYAVAIRSLLYNESVDWLYFMALATVAVGIAIYSYSGETPSEPEGQKIGDEIPYERVDTSHEEPTSYCEVTQGWTDGCTYDLPPGDDNVLLENSRPGVLSIIIADGEKQRKWNLSL